MNLFLQLYITPKSYIVYRIMWLRAKQRQDRWFEEVHQCAADLFMARMWFETHVELWREKTTKAKLLNKPGHESFANRQANDFAQMLMRTASFLDYINKYNSL